MAVASDILPGTKYKCIISCLIGPIETTVLIDTGAQQSGVSLAFLNTIPRFEINIKRKTQRECVSVDGQKVKALFTVCLPISLKSGVIQHEFEVINNLIAKALLGIDFLKQYKAKLTRIFPFVFLQLHFGIII